MKKTFITITIILCISVMLFSQRAEKKMTFIETVVLYPFENEMNFKAGLSKFGVPEKTKIKLYNYAPNGLGLSTEQSKQSLGVHTAFKRKGYNFIDIMPITPAKPIPGKVKSLDVWVWGGNFTYTMDIHLEDFRGYIHKMPLGDLHYYGWKNKSVDIHQSIPQAEPYAPSLKGLTFRKFRIWSTPTERVDRFHVFLDYFKAVSDIYSPQYNGFELEGVIANDELEEKKPSTQTSPASQ
ncbi:flagellar filament outer layer protein FlaA [Spirochaetota bacterium]